MKRKALKYLIVIYVIITLPVITCFLGNEYFRFQFLQVISNIYSKFTNIDYVFIGDSITAGGRSWATLINKPPYNTKNLAGNGYTTNQISAQAARAIQYKPKYLFVMAGTNDVFSIKDSLYNIAKFKQQYENLIQESVKCNCKVIFTLIPYQSEFHTTSLIDTMNAIAVQLLNKNNILYIDLNPVISKDGLLLSTSTIDGVHFSNKANEIWGDRLKKFIKK